MLAHPHAYTELQSYLVFYSLGTPYLTGLENGHWADGGDHAKALLLLDLLWVLHHTSPPGTPAGLGLGSVLRRSSFPLFFFFFLFFFSAHFSFFLH